MIPGLGRLLDWLCDAMVGRVELPRSGGVEPAVAWLLIAAENGVICVEPSGDAPDAAGRGRRDSAGDLLVLLVG